MITNRTAAGLASLFVALSALAAVLPLEPPVNREPVAPTQQSISAEETTPGWLGAREREIVRIQAHLERVERDLRAADVGHLEAAQREARELHLDRLREYREAGSFPHNHDFHGMRVPYFVDAHGTPCAVAYLIARSGHEGVVDRIADSRNHAYVPELTDDAEVVTWLMEAGLSVEEAARIQPSYGHLPYYPPYPDPRDEVSSGYALATALNLGLSGATIAWNLSSGTEDGSRWPGGLGVAVGAAGLGLGAYRMDAQGTPQVLGIVNAAAGVMSLAMGVRSLSRAGAEGVEPPSAAIDSRRGLSVRASPLLAVDGGAGLAVRLRF